MKSTIEVGDLVERHTSAIDMPIPPQMRRVYLVAEVENCALRGVPSWCKLHDDRDRLTAVKSLTLVQKGRE
jgi:hypothetical protein